MPNTSLHSSPVLLDDTDNDAAIVAGNSKPPADHVLSPVHCLHDSQKKAADGDDDSEDESILVPSHELRQRIRAAALDSLRELIVKIHGESNKCLANIIRDRVLHHLPVASAVRFGAVASSWRHAVSTPIFAHTQSYTHRVFSGVFFGPSGSVSYAPFPPVAAHSLPDSSLSFLQPYSVEVCSSTNGLLLCYARSSGTFIVCNPATAAWTAIPPPPCNPGDHPAAVLIFQPDVYNFLADYTVVIAFEIAGPVKGYFGFQTFSSSADGWSVSGQICEAEEIYPDSGVAAAGVAYWRTMMLTVIEYVPGGDWVRVVPWPMGYTEAGWEIGEMGGAWWLGLYCSAVTEKALQVYRLLPAGEWPEWVLVKSLKVERSADGVEDGCTGADEVEFWKADGRGEVVFSKRPWPLRFQSGEMEILLWAAGKVVGVNLANGQVRAVAASGGSNFISYISTLSALPISAGAEAAAQHPPQGEITG